MTLPLSMAVWKLCFNNFMNTNKVIDGVKLLDWIELIYWNFLGFILYHIRLVQSIRTT